MEAAYKNTKTFIPRKETEWHPRGFHSSASSLAQIGCFMSVSSKLE